MSRAQDKIDAWRERLNSSSLPVFSRTVREVGQVAQSAASSASDLSEVISHDASMAARIIQIANSPLFNVQNRTIDTISSAVVLVGFDAVRDLAISVSVIEEVLKGNPHSQVGHFMSRAFHAAAHARSFALAQDPAHAEEVFVAALLKGVGEMAFWSRAGDEGVALEAALTNATDPQAAEREVLGFELNTLSRQLADDWNLGELLVRTLSGHHDEDPLVTHVDLGHALAECLETDDVLDADMRRRLSQHLNVSAAEVDDLIEANTEATRQIADRFGVTQLVKARPRALGKIDGTTRDDADTGSVSIAPPGCGSSDAVVAALGRIAEALTAGAGRDELMAILLAGLAEGVGLELGYFALLSKGRDTLQIKYVSPAAAGLETQSKAVAAVPIATAALASREVLRAGADDAIWAPCAQGLVAQVHLAKKPLGILYGGSANRETLSDHDEAIFAQFALQASLILSQSR